MYRRGKGIVHDKRYTMSVSRICKFLDIQDRQCRIGDGFPKYSLGIRLECRIQFLFRCMWRNECEFHPHLLHSYGKQIIGPAVDSRGCHHVIATGCDIEYRIEVGSLTR